ncbi:MAG: hypothetical protein ACTHMC_19925 [Pseudobacter sp.]|uniref:hypothetical protein n=1 Tax=Pseudobacter sp. TaxID=2045420 RepID=UPI003F7F9479
MKQILWALLLISTGSLAQTNETARPGNEYDGVAGSPYLYKDWVKGTVYYKNGRVVDQFKLRFDCARNFLQLEFKGQSFSPQLTTIVSFVMYPKDTKDSVIFRKGFPPNGLFNGDTFYEVMQTGKAPLLHLLNKMIVEKKDMLPSATTKYFEEDDLYFLVVNGNNILLEKGDREKLAKQFPEQEAALLKYMNEEELKMRTAGDFRKFAAKYNELAQ